MSIQSITKHNRECVIQFFKQHWGSAQMVISTGIYNCDQLDGFIFEEEGEILGLLTYVIHQDAIEVISLDSIKEGLGIGSALMNEVESFAKQKGIDKITLITTNDNLHALKFYEKRDYRIVKVITDAVAKARQIKPSIPLVGNDGIPLHDELLLVKNLSKKRGVKLHELTIRKLAITDKLPIELLLLADPSEKNIVKYVENGEMYVAVDDEVIVGVYVLCEIAPSTVELMNIAVAENHQGKGIGKVLINHAIHIAKEKGMQSIELGTGNSSIQQLAFYQKCGFRMSEIMQDFFVANYDEPIFENGIQCRDMVRFKLEF